MFDFGYAFFFSLVVKLIGLRTGCQFFKKYRFFHCLPPLRGVLVKDPHLLFGVVDYDITWEE